MFLCRNAHLACLLALVGFLCAFKWVTPQEKKKKITRPNNIKFQLLIFITESLCLAILWGWEEESKKPKGVGAQFYLQACA